MLNFEFTITGLQGIEFTQEISDRVKEAARITVDRALIRARKRSAEEILNQVRFPDNYFKGSASRLSISSRPSRQNLEGVITGRGRPTSLSSFVQGLSSRGPVRVSVKPGRIKTMPGAFFIKLRAGNFDIDTKFNVGLAVRTANGQKPASSYKPLKIGKNLFLLYGPSVDQVFGGKKGVAVSLTPDILSYMETEFLRLLDL